MLTSVSQTIKGKYGVKSYQDTKNTYDWLVKAIVRMKYAPEQIVSHFQFDIGEIVYSCDSIEEFAEYAYSAPEYSFTVMRLSVLNKDKGDIWLTIDSRNQVFIGANSKRDLEQIVSLLRDTSLREDKIDAPTSVIYVANQDNSVTINGNSNIIANNNSSVSDKQEKTESKASGWIKGVFQGIIANLIWWILGIVAVALLAWAISNGYISR